MIKNSTLSQGECKVPLNFIPGQPYRTPLCGGYDQNLKLNVRRIRSHSLMVGPPSNYIKRFKSNEHLHPYGGSYDANECGVGRMSGTSLCKQEVQSNIDKNTERNEDCNPIDYPKLNSQKQTIQIQLNENEMSELSNESKYRSLDNMDELTSSLPDLNCDGAQGKHEPLLRKKSHSTDLSPMDRDEIILLGIVQDELRRKLPKTYHTTASIGLRNPMCLIGSLRRNTIHHRESVFTSPAREKLTSKKLNSIGSEYCGSLDRHRSSLLAKLRSPSKSPQKSPPTTPDFATTNTFPSLFTRARSYAERGSLDGEEYGHNASSSSSVDSVI